MHNSQLIAITGGIGSGKSVVSRVVAALGFPVYDCDAQAKMLMDSSREIKEAIAARIGRECIVDGHIDRAALSEIVFSSPEHLTVLNTIVHGAVREHLSGWHESLGHGVRFVETAILYQSGLDAMVDEVWEVTAPEELRIERVMRRNGLDRAAVKARIESQDSYIPEKLHPCRHILVNDGVAPLLPAIERLLTIINIKI